MKKRYSARYLGSTGPGTVTASAQAVVDVTSCFTTRQRIVAPDTCVPGCFARYLVLILVVAS
eukprot:1052112-Rhodomonas_salina.2